MIVDPKSIDEACQVEFFFADNLAAKRHILSAGDIIGKHTHDYSHLSIVGYGSVRVNTPDGSRVYDAGDCIVVKANTEHHITALEDSAWFCIHTDKE
jgi:quercetin dioxygenase-like cupin family protein